MACHKDYARVFKYAIVQQRKKPNLNQNCVKNVKIVFRACMDCAF